MSCALTEITFWLCGSGYSPAHRGKPSTTFVIAAQPPWVAMGSITIADIAPSLTTRVLWRVFSNGERIGKGAFGTRLHAPAPLHYDLPFSVSRRFSGVRNLPLPRV